MSEDKMPPVTDAEGLKRWHNDHGLPWGATFDGPDPVTMAKMVRPGAMNLTVHLANEHGVQADRYHGTQVEHMLAHVYGRFRAGQEHYHAQPGEPAGPGS
jgi:hypothetical protein